MKTEEVNITSEHITLGQLIKFVNLVESGGQVKDFLKSRRILINGVESKQRGRKLYPGDEVIIDEEITYKLT